jgi:hypothetical protein
MFSIALTVGSDSETLDIGYFFVSIGIVVHVYVLLQI